MLKQLDKLLIKSFFGPFIVAFGIAVFVLMMQFVWVYIDELLGKGIGIFTITELLGYLSISRIPMALPIAVLISTVMVMGNLAEKYELSSFKSCGISLLRVMLPLIIIMSFVAGFSYFCSNTLIPIANLKFGSRLYDIRRQKPALSLEEGVFNDDFQDFVIRIKNKGKDNQTINNVLIYNSLDNYDNLNQIVAEDGKMYTTDDKQYLVLRLNNGTQYQEVQSSNRENEKYPFVRTKFSSWQKVYDLKEFEINKTDENLFKSHQMMLSQNQLIYKIDSIEKRIAERRIGGNEIFTRYFTSIYKKKPKSDTVSVMRQFPNVAMPKMNKQVNFPAPLLQRKEDVAQAKNLLATFQENDRAVLMTRAKASARSVQSELLSLESSVQRTYKARNLHQLELHVKFSIAFICILFVFIGAPMGAIVRKGGFGFPLLISIVYFMVFIVLSILCKNLTEELVIDGVTAAWMPVMVLSPIAIILTYKAMNDSSFFDTTRISNFLARIISRFNRKKQAVNA